MFGLVLVSVGCRSIYQQTRGRLPPDPAAQLKLRVEEAQRAEKSAVAAETRLRDRLGRGLPHEAIAADVDRVEAATLELERRVASVRDAAARCPEPVASAGEIDRLHRRAQELQHWVQSLSP